jgi:[ribosomal protein S5]-alanine N-acetyltransferase
MRALTIEAEHIRLVLQTPAEVLARIEALGPAERAEVSPDWLARVRASSAADPWTHGFSVIDRGTGAVVGSCGYKGPPAQAGVVEIAYGIHQVARGRGYATEAARALVGFAFASSGVHCVRAHTRPGNSASARVLTRCGFERVGEVVDPEDGLVWRWEIRRQA